MATKIIEQCQVAPSSGAPAEQLLKLLHFDMACLPLHPLENLFFYTFQCSESRFRDVIVPNLKNSLSLSLKHFPPMAGKIVVPLTSGDSNVPFSHYVAGRDSVSLTAAVSDAGFVNLTGYRPRDADPYHDLVPRLPPADVSPESIKFSVAAFQVTLFPSQGICIGLTSHHAVADGVTIVGFLQTWASITKFNEDGHLLALGKRCLPFYDRDVVRDGDRLAVECWNAMKPCRPTLSPTVLPTHKVRATFVVNEAEIETLKNYVMNEKMTVARVSSFTVVCALLWTCLVKSATVAGEESAADGAPAYLYCAADCRARLSPPLPDTYFGNCLTAVVAESTNGKLKGKEGFLSAAAAIGDAVRESVGGIGRETADGSMRSLLESTRRFVNGGVVGVIGSPRFDLYGLDYGWGRAIKFEAVQMDRSGSVSICRSRDFRGGMEIGLSAAKGKMDAFAAFFSQGINGECSMIASKL